LGFKVSWIAFAALEKEAVLRLAGLRDTGKVDEFYEAQFLGAALPGGWYVLFVKDPLYTWPERLSAFSAQCRLVACQVHEGIMWSASWGYAHGICEWALWHDSDEGGEHLSVEGKPPEAFTGIRDAAFKEQQVPQSGRFQIDYIFDIPVDTAQSVCGFRHDRSEYDWGQTVFTQLEET
jgi:hypothetical protein